MSLDGVDDKGRAGRGTLWTHLPGLAVVWVDFRDEDCITKVAHKRVNTAGASKGETTSLCDKKNSVSDSKYRAKCMGGVYE